MHIELVDSLRCPQPHADTWLVACVSRFDGRDIVEGTLGCPVCHREFPIVAGEVDFAPDPAVGRHDPDKAAPALGTLPATVDGDQLLRARALLSLDEGGGVVLLGGAWGKFATALADVTLVTPLLLNPPPAIQEFIANPSAIRVVDAVPIAGGALRAAWLDSSTATAPFLDGVARALRQGGRLVAPASAPVPGGLRELARDATEWVAEPGVVASTPVPLRRR